MNKFKKVKDVALTEKKKIINVDVKVHQEIKRIKVAGGTKRKEGRSPG